jgi:chromosome segregation ATPase
MLRELFQYTRHLLQIKERTDQNTAEIKELREEVRKLSSAMERLVYEVRRVSEHEAHEREKMALRLEIELLKRERTLGPGSADEATETGE